MIISASRRTDIPSYYSDWFINRINEGFVCVRNPMNYHQVSRISLNSNVVDGLVIWTKNAIPLINRIDSLFKYNFYFQYSLNPYENDIEKNIPSKLEYILPNFCNLSHIIGKERIVWRYDPILFNEKYNINYHKHSFELLASKLCSYTEKCTISFIDLYANTRNNIKPYKIYAPSESEQDEIIFSFVDIAKKYGIYIDTCAELIDYSKYGVAHACCIDKTRLERIGNYKLNVKKDKEQRSICGCVSSIDIGSYNTCKNGCVYCYANYNSTIVNKNNRLHDPLSPFLYGKIEDDDILYERKMESYINNKMTVFDYMNN